MTAKEYLSRYLESTEALRERERILREEWSRISKLTASLTGMPRGNGGTDWSDKMNALIDEERELHAEEMRLTEIKAGILKTINAVPDGSLRTLLTLRYIGGKSLNATAREMHYEYGYVRQLHPKALEAVEKILSEQRTNINEHFS